MSPYQLSLNLSSPSASPLLFSTFSFASPFYPRIPHPTVADPLEVHCGWIMDAPRGLSLLDWLSRAPHWNQANKTMWFLREAFPQHQHQINAGKQTFKAHQTKTKWQQDRSPWPQTRGGGRLSGGFDVNRGLGAVFADVDLTGVTGCEWLVTCRQYQKPRRLVIHTHIHMYRKSTSTTLKANTHKVLRSPVSKIKLM